MNIFTTNLDNVPALDSLQDRELGREFFEALHDHIEEYWVAVAAHTERHLKTLGVRPGQRG